MTEQDLENSTDLMALTAQQLRERLKESKKQQEKIKGSGTEMDGNTSTAEEEEFVQGLKDEMPDDLEKIDMNLSLLVDIEKLVQEVKQTLSLDKMTELRDKVQMATDNVEQSEALVIKRE